MSNPMTQQPIVDIAITKTEQIAAYLRSLFVAEMKGIIDDVPMPRWDLDLLEDCRYAAIVLRQAAQNQRELIKCINHPG